MACLQLLSHKYPTQGRGMKRKKPSSRCKRIKKEIHSVHHSAEENNNTLKHKNREKRPQIHIP